MKKRATSQNSILERNQEFFLDKQRLGKLIKSKWDFLCCINKVWINKIFILTQETTNIYLSIFNIDFSQKINLNENRYRNFYAKIISWFLILDNH